MEPRGDGLGWGHEVQVFPFFPLWYTLACPQRQPQCPGPAARDVPGTVLGKSQLQGPGNPQLCRANTQFSQPVNGYQGLSPPEMCWEV